MKKIIVSAVLVLIPCGAFAQQNAPGMAMGNLFISTSQALSNAAHNATNNQQQSYVTMQASTTQGVALHYGVDTSTAAVGISEILNNDPAAVRQQTGIAKFNE